MPKPLLAFLVGAVAGGIGSVALVASVAAFLIWGGSLTVSIIR